MFFEGKKIYEHVTYCNTFKETAIAMRLAIMRITIFGAVYSYSKYKMI